MQGEAYTASLESSGMCLRCKACWDNDSTQLLLRTPEDWPMSLQVLAKENARIDPVVLALADLIAEQPDRLLPHIHFEGDYCLACDWRRLDLKESAEVPA